MVSSVIKSHFFKYESINFWTCHQWLGKVKGQDEYLISWLRLNKVWSSLHIFLKYFFFISKWIIVLICVNTLFNFIMRKDFDRRNKISFFEQSIVIPWSTHTKNNTCLPFPEYCSPLAMDHCTSIITINELQNKVINLLTFQCPNKRLSLGFFYKNYIPTAIMITIFSPDINDNS